jgi:hypothetical protein
MGEIPPIPQPLPNWEGELNSLLSPVGERRVGEERGALSISTGKVTSHPGNKCPALFNPGAWHFV